MNSYFVSAAALNLFAFLAHTISGTRESLGARPQEAGKTEHAWVQNMGAFQLVTVDLLLMTILLAVIGMGRHAFTQEIAWLLITWNLAWSAIWLLTLFLLKRSAKDFLIKGQWLLFLGTALLVFLGIRG